MHEPDKRTTNGQFLPGHSGNPGGRPKGVAEVAALAREHTEQAIRALAHIAKSGKSEAARVSASSALLDRGWGKPVQAIVQTTTEKRCAADWSDAELVAFLEDYRATIANAKSANGDGDDDELKIPAGVVPS